MKTTTKSKAKPVILGTAKITFAVTGLAKYRLPDVKKFLLAVVGLRDRGIPTRFDLTLYCH